MKKIKTVLFAFLLMAAGAVQAGQKPLILKFLPLRTVVKPGTEIPLFAIVKNDSNVAIELTSNLLLPDYTTLLNGSLTVEHGLINPHQTDSVNWIITFNKIGTYNLKLKLFSTADTTEKELSVTVTDTCWKQKKFLLSAYNPPYTWSGPPYVDSAFVYYKNANFDNLLCVRDDDSLMHQVHKYRLKYFLNVGALIGEDILRGSPDSAPPEITSQQMQQLDEAIDKYKNDSLLRGYYICDEPFPSAFSNIAKVVARIREKDPTRLGFVNIWPYFENEIGDDKYIEDFIQTTKVELLSYDRYNFFNGWDDNDEYFAQLKRIRKQALKYDIPFCNIFQGVGTNGTSADYLDWRTPNRAEHRWLVYSSLTFGVHGIIWFHWDAEDWGLVENPDRDTVYPSIQSINAEIDSLSQIMLHLFTTDVYFINNHSAPKIGTRDKFVKKASDDANLVVGAFKDEIGNENYFMLMNKSYSDAVSSQITVNCTLDSLKLFNVINNNWEAVPFEKDTAGSVFTVNLRKGGGVLFKYKSSNAAVVPASYNTSSQFQLQNYPNPFGTQTTIHYTIPKCKSPLFSGSDNYFTVQLAVFDMFGNKVATLINRRQLAGSYHIKFNADYLPEGVYFYQLKIGPVISTKKMLILR